jgi:regulator of protease activity HflC (stomatin/prohibitin superfamily)
MTFIVFVVVLALLILLVLTRSMRILPEYQQGVIFRLGRTLRAAKGPGLFLVWPLIDRMETVTLQEVLSDVPPQDVITRDGVTVNVDAIVYLQVVDATKAIVEVEDYMASVSQQCVATLRSVCGTVSLDELLSKRDEVTSLIQTIVDGVTENWGVKVTRVEITDVVLPAEMRRAIAREAEAERERRAQLELAKGEAEAAEQFKNAASIMADHPIAYQLRMLQTMAEVAAEKNSTLVLPIPIELLRFLQPPPSAR